MIFFDSVTAADIPTTARGVMGYVDGGKGIVWSDADWARFPDATKIRIAGHAATDDGDMGDVENYDMLPTEAPVWVALRRASGDKPWWWPAYVQWPLLYCNKGNWDAVQAVMRSRGLVTDYVIADPYPPDLPAGTEHEIPGALGVQFAWAAQSGGHYDLTLMPDSFDPGVIARNQQAQAVLTREVTMGKGYVLLGADGGLFAFGDVAALVNGPAGGNAVGRIAAGAKAVDLQFTPTGKGYWITASDGGVFSFGDAAFEGSMGGQHLNAPVVGMAVPPDVVLT